MIKYKAMIVIVYSAIFMAAEFDISRAGSVTATPTPVYPSNNIVIPADGNVLFTASSPEGTVTIDPSFSNFTNGTPSYAGSGDSVTAAVTFTDSASGLDNSCAVVVSHTVPNGFSIDQCTTDQYVLYNVIVPTVTVANANLLPGGTINGQVNNSLNTIIAQNHCAWSISVEVHPLDAVPYILCRVAQDLNGTTIKYYRSPAPGTTGVKQYISASALDGISYTQTPVGGFINLNSSDDPSQIDAAGTFSSFYFNDSFDDYLQYQIQCGVVPWVTLSHGTWAETGTVTATGSTGAWTAGGSTVTALGTGGDFSDSTASPNLTNADKTFYPY